MHAFAKHHFDLTIVTVTKLYSCLIWFVTKQFES